MLSGIGESTTIPEANRIAARADPDATFLIVDGQRHSYADIEDEAARIAAGLRERGIGSGDRVALAANNRREWIVSWLAITRLGAIVVTLNVAYREREFVYMLNQSGARVLLCVESDAGFEFRPFLDSIRSQIPFLFEGTLPDFNIGTNSGTSCALEFERVTAEIAGYAAGFTSIVNGRFKGGWTTRHYGAPVTGVHAIQMELAQSTHLATETVPFAYDEEKAGRLREHLKAILLRLEAVAYELKAMGN